MRTEDRLVIRRVLADLADRAPDPPGFRELGAIEVRPYRVRPRRHGVVALGGVFLAALAAALILSSISTPRDNDLASSDRRSTLLVPSWVPHDLVLSIAETLDANGEATSEVGSARSILLTYLTDGAEQWVEGDRVVFVGVVNLLMMSSEHRARGEVVCQGDTECLAHFDESGCIGRASVERGEVDPDSCTEMIVDSIVRDLGNGSLIAAERLEIRGRPASVVEVELVTEEGVLDYSVHVTVFEGEGLVTSVGTHQYDRATAVRIAESIREISPAEFARLAS